MFVYDMTFAHESNDLQPTDHCSNSSGGKFAKWLITYYMYK